MSNCRQEHGVGLVELVVVVAIALVVAAMAVPKFITTRQSFRTVSDARDISSELLLTKMRAAASFSKARLYADINAKNFRIEVWDKTNSCWKTEGTPNCNTQPSQPLAPGVRFSYGSLATPPAGTQASIGLAPVCQDNGGTDIANSSCLIFNSRGIPVDNGGTPTANGALYITDGTQVYGTTVSATGFIQGWSSPAATANWQRR